MCLLVSLFLHSYKDVTQNSGLLSGCFSLTRNMAEKAGVKWRGSMGYMYD